MKRILIAAAIITGFAGIASAQQAPMIQGDYSANVENSYNLNASMRSHASQGATIDYANTASMRDASSWDRKADHTFDIHTGK